MDAVFRSIPVSALTGVVDNLSKAHSESTIFPGGNGTGAAAGPRVLASFGRLSGQRPLSRVSAELLSTPVPSSRLKVLTTPLSTIMA